jgi:hypothetical protein
MSSQQDDLVLSREEIVQLIDSEARQRYDIDGEEFVRQVRDGVFDECGGAADLISLARLLGGSDKSGLAA